MSNESVGQPVSPFSISEALPGLPNPGDNEKWKQLDDDGDLESSESEKDEEAKVKKESDSQSECSTNWKPWSYKKLVKLVKKAKGAATKPVINFIKKNMLGTKLILVMGKTGTGKTSLLRELTGLDLHVGHTINSGTLQYSVCPAILDGEQYLFVDTAGFGASDLDDLDNFHDIMSCLSVLGPFVEFSGVLFVFGKVDNRLTKEDLQTIRWIECFCGPEFFQHITFITTRWDEYNERAFPTAWEKVQELRDQENIKQILRPRDRYHGGSLYHHGLPGGEGSAESFSQLLYLQEHASERGDELRNLIRRRYANAKSVPLQIMREREEGTLTLDTQAGVVLTSKVQKTAIRIKESRAILVRLSDDMGIVSTAGSSPPRTRKHNLSAPGSDADDSDGTGSRNDNEKGTAKEHPTWFKRLLGWIEVAYNVSSYFESARKNGRESTNRSGPSSGSEWSIWTTLQGWWSGSS